MAQSTCHPWREHLSSPSSSPTRTSTEPRGAVRTQRQDRTQQGFRSCRTSDTNARSTGIVTGISNDNYVAPPSTGGYTNSRYMGPGGTRNSFQIGSDFDETLSGSRSSISNMSQQLSQITQSTGRSARSAPSEAASAAELQEITARNEWEKNIEQSQLPFSSQPDTQHRADRGRGRRRTQHLGRRHWRVGHTNQTKTDLLGRGPQSGRDRKRGITSAPRGT